GAGGVMGGRVTGRAAVAGLVGVLALAQLDEVTYRGVSMSIGPMRVFGGQVASQALVAAGRTVDPQRQVHSLHGYFVRPGDASEPIRYVVENKIGRASGRERGESCAGGAGV